jgi:hypothetical protein
MGLSAKREAAKWVLAKAVLQQGLVVASETIPQIKSVKLAPVRLQAAKLGRGRPSPSTGEETGKLCGFAACFPRGDQGRAASDKNLFQPFNFYSLLVFSHRGRE